MAVFKLKWSSRCYLCGVFLPAGEWVHWHHVRGHSCRNSWECDARAKRSVAIDKRRPVCDDGESQKGGPDE